jgi:signal peptidase I
MVRAVLPVLGLIVATFFNLALVFGLIRPHILEAFIISSNSDAPTVVGPHQIAVCPRCGGKLIVPYDEEQPPLTEGEAVLGICATCLQTSTVLPSNSNVQPGDRILPNKLLVPRRWDLVTVRSPQNPSEQYVKRLIGLPGEKVVIKDGQVWVNGKLLQPLAEISSLRFTPTGGPQADALWGSPARPAKLGPGENFVVGDFAEHSADSRTWGKPIPQAHITGVVSVIYYPISRWRIFR